MIAFWTVLAGPMGDPLGSARLPASLLVFVIMLCVIRLFYWTYLDMSDDTEDNLDSTNRGTNLSMSVFKIQINPPAIETGNSGVEVERVFPNTNSAAKIDKNKFLVQTWYKDTKIKITLKEI